MLSLYNFDGVGYITAHLKLWKKKAQRDFLAFISRWKAEATQMTVWPNEYKRAIANDSQEFATHVPQTPICQLFPQLQNHD